MDDDLDPPDPARPEIIMGPDQLAGAWANDVRVAVGEHEFTIDFIRVDPFAPVAIVVARVSGSAAFVMRLIATLRTTWDEWAKGAMPPEVHGGEDGIQDR